MSEKEPSLTTSPILRSQVWLFCSSRNAQRISIHRCYRGKQRSESFQLCHRASRNIHRTKSGKREYIYLYIYMERERERASAQGKLSNRSCSIVFGPRSLVRQSENSLAMTRLVKKFNQLIHINLIQFLWKLTYAKKSAFYFPRFFSMVTSNPYLLYLWGHELAMKPVGPQKCFIVIQSIL